MQEWANEMAHLHCDSALCKLSGCESDGGSTMTWSRRPNSDDEITSFGTLAIYTNSWSYVIRPVMFGLLP